MMTKGRDYKKEKFLDYKYVVLRPQKLHTTIKGYNICATFFMLRPDGLLNIFPNYRWDGSSGPAVDTAKGMSASAGHDAFCQALRQMWFFSGRYFVEKEHVLLVEEANKFYRSQCVADGMWRIKAWWRYKALCSPLGTLAAEPSPETRAIHLANLTVPEGTKKVKEEES